MDYITIAFADSALPHAQAARATLMEIGAVEVWRGFWIMSGSCSSPGTRQQLQLLYVALAHPPHLPPGVIISKLDEDSEIRIGLSMSEEGRAFFYRHLAPHFERKRSAVETNRFHFFGSEEVRFAGLAEQANGMLLPPREITPLCRSMLRFGSDKSLGWHSYTPLYTLLIAQLKQAPRCMLEIGIGSNFEDVPSAMGRNGTPGASLRGWRDYLPATRIFGADVDRRILFEEERIRTYYVDQLDPMTIDQLWDELPRAPFHLIVDDGLHTFEAAANTMARSIGHLDDEGLYIVEDVPVARIQAYASLADARGLDGFVVQIPHPFNESDNCLLVAAKPFGWADPIRQVAQGSAFDSGQSA